MYVLRKSAFDPSFVEVCNEEGVVEEIPFSLQLKKSPRFETLEMAKEWLKEEERKRARGKAIASLARRDLASNLLKTKLKEKGFSSVAIESAIVGLPLDDDNFWQRTIEREWKRGIGPHRIVAKWVPKGMPKQLVFQQITLEMQAERIQEAFTQKKESAKIARLLISKGFDASLVEKFFRLAHS